MSENATLKSEVLTVTGDHNEVFDDILALDLATCTVTVCLASISKTEAIPLFERLRMTTEMTEEFSKIIKDVLKQYKTEWKEEELLFREYAMQSQPDEYEIGHIDLSAHSMLVEQISPLSALASVEVFEEENKFVTGLRFYVIIAQPWEGDPIYFFRSYGPKKMLRRSRGFAAYLKNGSYDRITQPLFLFDEEIDCLSRSGIMFIINKKNFQNIFRLSEKAIRKAAKETLEAIKITVPILNFEEFAHVCEGHLWKQRKLKNIAAKPYLSRITMDHIKKVIEKNNLPLQIMEVEGKETLIYDRKDKWVLLKLLDDDYLWSLLTEQSYEVTGKREIP